MHLALIEMLDHIMYVDCVGDSLTPGSSLASPFGFERNLEARVEIRLTVQLLFP